MSGLIKRREFLAGFFLACILLSAAWIILAWSASQHAAIQVEWSTASEVDTAGFNLYRKEPGAQEVYMVNHQLIPAQGDPYLGSDYVYQDQSVQLGQEYIYWLEEVDINGDKSPVEPLSIKAKTAPKAGWLIAALFMVTGLSGLIWALRTRA